LDYNNFHEVLTYNCRGFNFDGNIDMKTKLVVIPFMLILFMFGCSGNSSNSVLGTKNKVITESRIKADFTWALF